MVLDHQDDHTSTVRAVHHRRLRSRLRRHVPLKMQANIDKGSISSVSGKISSRTWTHREDTRNASNTLHSTICRGSQRVLYSSSQAVCSQGCVYSYVYYHLRASGLFRASRGVLQASPLGRRRARDLQYEVSTPSKMRIRCATELTFHMVCGYHACRQCADDGQAHRRKEVHRVRWCFVSMRLRYSLLA